jgi:hypothetical protein
MPEQPEKHVRVCSARNLHCKKTGTTWGIMHGAACEKNVASPDFIKGALLLVFPSLYPRLLP